MKKKLHPAISVARNFEENKTAACLGIGATHKAKGEIIILCGYQETEGLGQSTAHRCIAAVRGFSRFPQNLVKEIRASNQKADCYGLVEDIGLYDLLFSLSQLQVPKTVFGKDLGENAEINLQMPEGIETERLKGSQQQALEMLDDKRLLVQCPLESIALGLKKAMIPETTPTALALAVGLLVAGIERNRYVFADW